MLISPAVTKTSLKHLCDEYIIEYDRYNDSHMSNADMMFKLLTYKNPGTVINKLKKQYFAAVELFKCIDCDKNNRHISEQAACELLKVVPMFHFEPETWTGKFCAYAILESVGFEEIKSISMAISNDVKADTAKEVVAIHEKDIFSGYRVSWDYTIKVLTALNGDRRVQDIIETVKLKYIL